MLIILLYNVGPYPTILNLTLKFHLHINNEMGEKFRFDKINREIITLMTFIRKL